MKFVSICNSIYSKLVGVDVEELQAKIQKLTMELVDQKQQNHRMENRVQEQNVAAYHTQTIIRTQQEKIDALLVERNQLRNKPAEIVVEKVMNMSDAAYQKLVSELEPPIVSANTTPHGVGYLLGIQRALAVFRNRYVV